MRKIWSAVPGPLRRDAIAGGLAGLVGGLVFWWCLEAQSMTPTVRGLLGLKLSGAGVGFHLLVSILVGAAFGAISRYQPPGYAATISSGTLFGLLWWIVGPITFGALLDGRGPAWSLDEAGVAFPSLVGHLLYGGMTGFGFHVLVTLYLRLRPEPERTAPAELAKKRVVILGGGFGGVGVAQRMEQLISRGPGMEITLVSQSNHLLFTPMLAEVASSGAGGAAHQRTGPGILYPHAVPACRSVHDRYLRTGRVGTR